MQPLCAALLVLGAASPFLDDAALLDALRTRNPEIRALAARVEAKKASIGRQGSWMDPKLSLELMNVPMLDGPKVTVMQMVPLQAQPALMGEMAQLDVKMAETSLSERLLMLRAEVQTALVDLAYVASASRILDRNQDLAERMARIAETRYALGQGMQPDVLRAHLAKTRLFQPRYTLTSQQQMAEARLAALVPELAPAPPPLNASPQLPPLSDFLRRADQNNPMLHMQQWAVRHAELGVELARREQIPDLEVGVAAGKQMNDPMPYVSAMASINLPVWWSQKQAQRVIEAERERDAAQALLDQRQRQLHAQMAQSHAQIQAMLDQLALIRGGLTVQTRQSFQSSLAAYQVGQVDFLMLLDSQMALLDVEMTENMVLADIQRMRAMLDAWTGIAS